MPFSEEEVEELKQLCPDVSQCEEAGCIFLLLPQLKLPDCCSPIVVDALLCPTARDGYESRLFFSERITSGSQLNWNAERTRIVERNWYAFSWKVSAGLRLIQLVAAQLRAFK